MVSRMQNARDPQEIFHGRTSVSGDIAAHFSSERIPSPVIRNIKGIIIYSQSEIFRKRT